MTIGNRLSKCWISSRNKAHHPRQPGRIATCLHTGAGAPSGEPPRLILVVARGGPAVRPMTQIAGANALVMGKNTYLLDAGYGATV